MDNPKTKNSHLNIVKTNLEDVNIVITLPHNYRWRRRRSLKETCEFWQLCISPPSGEMSTGKYENIKKLFCYPWLQQLLEFGVWSLELLFPFWVSTTTYPFSVLSVALDLCFGVKEKSDGGGPNNISLIRTCTGSKEMAERCGRKKRIKKAEEAQEQIHSTYKLSIMNVSKLSATSAPKICRWQKWMSDTAERCGGKKKSGKTHPVRCAVRGEQRF